MKTQKQAVLSYLKRGRKLTPSVAWEKMGITKLSTRIGELCRDGYPIGKKSVAVKNRYGVKTQVMQYWL